MPYRRCLEVLKARDLLIWNRAAGRRTGHAPGESKDGAEVYRIRSILGTGDDR